MKNFFLMGACLLFCAQTHAQTLGAYNRQVDGALFQNKCSSCHSVGFISDAEEILPSEVWCLINRMAHHHGANLYCREQNSRIYYFLVNYNATSRADELENALKCIPESRRVQEKKAIEEAENRYK